MHRRPASAALFAVVALLVATFGTVDSGAAPTSSAAPTRSAGALPVRAEVPRAAAQDVPAPASDPVDREPEVVAALPRAEAARQARDAATAAADAARAAAAEATAVHDRVAAELATLDAEITEVGAAERAALDRHEVARKSYVDTAIAAYVAGAPASLELKASLIEEPVDRARSLALAESVGDIFSRRAAVLKKSSDALTEELEDLADERGEIATRFDAAQRDLDATTRALAEAEAAGSAAEVELAAATQELDAARAVARERIDRAAERFRLGEIDLADLRRLADPRIAVGDVPVRAYDAYVAAVRAVDPQMPGCRVSWWALAAIGKIETRHGSYGGAVILPNGDVAPRILGPPLTGGPFATVTDTDGGALDGDTLYDRAVGPMQFIPSTWRSSGADGNGDGVADPHNYYDAAVAAARYLCRGARGVPLDTEAGMRAAALSYNRSQRYANEVIAAARRYGGLGGAPVTVPD